MLQSIPGVPRISRLTRPAAPAPERAGAPREPSPDGGDLLTSAETAQRLGVSSKALERWRGTGAGPAFVRLSRKTIRYRAEHVEAFVTERVRTSTAAA
jgi:hypothetical protein